MSILQIISLGNDIVDLSDPDSVNLTNQSKFVQRVFTDTEREEADGLPREAQSAFYWKMWAAKEASYKAVKRMNPATVFSPRKFQYMPHFNSVDYEDISCKLEFQENTQYIIASSYVYGFESSLPEKIESSDFRPAAHASYHKVQNWICESAQIKQLVDQGDLHRAASYSQESSLCRTYALSRIAEHMKTENVLIEKYSNKANSIPILWVDEKPTGHLLSVSHHGRFCAVLFCPK